MDADEYQQEYALRYFLAMMHEGKIEYRNGTLWRCWELRRGWLEAPRRMEKRASNTYLMLRVHDKAVGRPLYVMAHRVIWAYFKGIPGASLVINHKTVSRTIIALKTSNW